jgi:DNA-binding IclR family transcriptional regulator
MLAQLPTDDLEHFLATADLTPRTETTVTDVDALRAVIATVRAKGYAVNDGELAAGIRGVAAAVRYPDGRPAAAINIALTRPFRDGEADDVLGPSLLEAAAKIEKLLVGTATF